ncbi:MAG: hypothetical protein ABIA59_09435 [Candidatus Latescibacterota bacterium]
MCRARSSSACRAAGRGSVPADMDVMRSETSLKIRLFAAAVPALLVLILAVYTEPMTRLHPMFAEGGDHLVYIEMADKPLQPYAPPYCYRLLMPTIAGALPFTLAVNFYLLTLLFTIGTGILLFYVMRDIGMSDFDSFMGVVLFYSLNWGTKFVLFDFWLTESALFFFAVLSLWMILRRRDGWLVLSLCMAVLSKESALFLLPLIYTLRARRLFDGAALLRAAVVSVAPIMLYLFLRLLVPANNSYSPLSLWNEIGMQRLTGGLAGYLRGGTVGTWGIAALLLPAVCGGRGRGFALRSIPFLLLVYLQPFFAVNVDRLLVLAFIVVIPLAADGLRNIRDRFRLSHWMAAGYVFTPFMVILIKSGYQSPSPEQQLLFLAIWTVPVAVVKWRGRVSLIGG